MSCVEEHVLIESEIDRVLTSYRESPKLLHVLRTYLRQVAQVYSSICDLPSYFDLSSAQGDQLTLIGKRMGFPRCHCVCDTQPVFGFECEGDSSNPVRQVVGFCEDGSWAACDDSGTAEICILDDNLYRSLLVARSYQMQARFGYEDLLAALQTIFGAQATILDSGHGRVVLAPGRELSQMEVASLQIIPRVLPIAPGITTRWHFGTRPVFGFGTGWGGFCLEWSSGEPLTTTTGHAIMTTTGETIITQPLTKGADWMCEIDVRPYSC